MRWPWEKRRTEIEAAIDAGETLAAMGQRFGCTRQNMNLVIRRLGLHARHRLIREALEARREAATLHYHLDSEAARPLVAVAEELRRHGFGAEIVWRYWNVPHLMVASRRVRLVWPETPWRCEGAVTPWWRFHTYRLDSIYVALLPDGRAFAFWPPHRVRVVYLSVDPSRAPSVPPTLSWRWKAEDGAHQRACFSQPEHTMPQQHVPGV